MSARRTALTSLTGPSHAGLWLDKFLGEDDNDNKARPRLVRESASLPEPGPYRAYHQAWRAALETTGATVAEATVDGRLAVSLGAESVLETSIALHRTYGVPIIPGSALKGLASSYADRFQTGEGWRKGGAHHRTVFGDTDSAGHITFHDALPLPGKWKLQPDVLTVHHQDYYNKGGSAPPADWDSPVPVPFLSATGTFLVALAGPTDWVAAARELLARALTEEGVGAKTSSGYGRLKLELPKPPPPSPAVVALDSLAARLEQMHRNDIPKPANQGGLAKIAQALLELDADTSLKRELARQVLAKARSYNAWDNRDRKRQPWWAAISELGGEP